MNFTTTIEARKSSIYNSNRFLPFTVRLLDNLNNLFLNKIFYYYCWSGG